MKTSKSEEMSIGDALESVSRVCNSIHRTAVHKWRSERRAPEAHRGAIATLTGIAVEAWDTWEPNGEPIPDPKADEPKGPKYALAPPRELSTLEDELRRSVQELNRFLEGGALSPTQAAGLHAKKITALASLAKMQADRGIHEHPDFAGLAEDLIAAVVAELGPEAPEGIEGRIADRFEALQAARAAAGERRAA